MGYDLEYAIYQKGYGPTILTLETYVRELFPTLFLPGTGARHSALFANSDSTTYRLRPAGTIYKISKT
jgi:hypothetical protein